MATRKKPPADTPIGADAAVRFVITLGPAPRARAMAAAAALDLDRLPDARGRPRMLVSADQMQRLIDQGHQIQVTATVPVAPLSDSLILSDRQADRWLEERIGGAKRRRGR